MIIETEGKSRMIHFYNNYIPSGLKTCFFCQKLVFNAFALVSW